MRRHLEGIDLATTPALLRRATPLAVEPLDDALATTHALLRRATLRGAFLLRQKHLLQLTLSCGERRFSSSNTCAYLQLQLTLSCGERPNMEIVINAPDVATTHALLRRATWKKRKLKGKIAATTPALLRRATPGKYLVRLSAWCYNSRSPAESDQRQGKCQKKYCATTHALLRRATIHHSFSSVSFVSYNSRSPAESDGNID